MNQFPGPTNAGNRRRAPIKDQAQLRERLDVAHVPGARDIERAPIRIAAASDGKRFRLGSVRAQFRVI
jgi:hypothetical protein